MARIAETPAVPLARLPFKSFDPVRFGGASRLTFKRLRRPTRLPTMGSGTGFVAYLQRLSAMFSGR